MRGYIYLFLMFLTSGFGTVFMKILLNAGMNPFELQFYSCSISLIILQVMSKGKLACFPLKKAKGNCFKNCVITALVGFVIFELSFNFAMQYMSVTHTIILYYLNPLFLYFVSFIFLKDRRLEFNILSGILISFIGVYLTVTNGSLLQFDVDIRGIVAILVSIICIVFFILYSKKNNVDDRGYVVWGQIISVILCASVVFAMGNPFVPNFYQLLLLIGIAVLYNILNAVFYLKAIQLLSVGKLSTLSYLSPIITTILAVLILKEPLYWNTVLGLGFVIFGNLFAHKKQKN